MNESGKLRSFAHKLKEGYHLMNEERYEEAKEAFEPFIAMMKEANHPPFRLFYSYSIAQLRTGDIEGFFNTYHELQEIPLKSKEEEQLKKQIDELFFNIMKEWEQKEH